MTETAERARGGYVITALPGKSVLFLREGTNDQGYVNARGLQTSYRPFESLDPSTNDQRETRVDITLYVGLKDVEGMQVKIEIGGIHATGDEVESRLSGAVTSLAEQLSNGEGTILAGAICEVITPLLESLRGTE